MIESLYDLAHASASFSGVGHRPTVGPTPVACSCGTISVPASPGSAFSRARISDGHPRARCNPAPSVRLLQGRGGCGCRLARTPRQAISATPGRIAGGRRSNSVSASSSDCSCEPTDARRPSRPRRAAADCPRSACASSGRSRWHRCPSSESPPRGWTNPRAPACAVNSSGLNPATAWRSRSPTSYIIFNSTACSSWSP